MNLAMVLLSGLTMERDHGRGLKFRKLTKKEELLICYGGEWGGQALQIGRGLVLGRFSMRVTERSYTNVAELMVRSLSW